MISINFLSFFTIEILNKYYSDQLCNDFTIVPSARTASVMRAANLVVKQYDNRHLTGNSADAATGVVTVGPGEGTQFVFFMRCNNPLFYNFTNSPMGARGGNLLYFTNSY